MKARGAQRVLTIGVAALLALALLVVVFSGGEESDLDGSAISAQPTGRYALSLLIEELGHPVENWRRRPGHLPADGGLLWLASLAPNPALIADSVDDAAAAKASEVVDEQATAAANTPVADALTLARAEGTAGLRHYREYVEAGGSLVAAVRASDLERLIDEYGFDELAGLTVGAQVFQPGALEARWYDGETLVLERVSVAVLDASGRVAPAGSEGAARALLEVEQLPRGTEPPAAGGALILEVDVGRGRLILLGSDQFLENRFLGAGDHALIAVRLVEHCLSRAAVAGTGASARVRFDEYALGLWKPTSKLALAFSGSARLLTVQLLALLCVLGWRSAWPREFPRDPTPLQSASPLLRARARSRLLVRAGRYERLADDLLSGVRARLARRARIPRSVAQDPEQLGAALAGALLDPRAAAPIAAALAPRAVPDRASLDRLASDLATLERNVTDALAPRTRRLDPQPTQ